MNFAIKTSFSTLIVSFFLFLAHSPLCRAETENCQEAIRPEFVETESVEGPTKDRKKINWYTFKKFYKRNKEMIIRSMSAIGIIGFALLVKWYLSNEEKKKQDAKKIHFKPTPNGNQIDASCLDELQKIVCTKLPKKRMGKAKRIYALRLELQTTYINPTKLNNLLLAAYSSDDYESITTYLSYEFARLFDEGKIWKKDVLNLPKDIFTEVEKQYFLISSKTLRNLFSKKQQSQFPPRAPITVFDYITFYGWKNFTDVITTKKRQTNSIFLDLNNFDLTDKDVRALLSKIKLEKYHILELKYNKLCTIEDHLFGNASCATSLDLSENELGIDTNYLAEHAFDGLNNLEELRLSNNKIKNIKSGGLEALQNLTHLYLDNNMLALLLLPKMDSLEVLDCSNNKLSVFPKLDHLLKLRHLDLSFNQLQTIPPNTVLTQKQNALKIVNVSYNGLTTIPKTFFQNCTEAVIINLSHNELTYLPPKLFAKCKRLQKISLKGNKLSEMPTAELKKVFKGMPQTVQVYLKETGLSPYEIREIKSFIVSQPYLHDDDVSPQNLNGLVTQKMEKFQKLTIEGRLRTADFLDLLRRPSV